MGNKINILDVPEVYNLEAKYQYFQYLPDESYVINNGARKIVLSGVYPKLSEGFDNIVYDGSLAGQISNEVNNSIESIINSYGISTDADDLLNNSNLEEDNGNTNTVSFSRENQYYRNNVKDLISEYISSFANSEQDPERNYSNIFNQSVNLENFNYGGGVSGIIIDSKISGSITEDLLRSQESNAISDLLSQEATWKYFATDTRPVSIYRYGIHVSQSRRALWDNSFFDEGSFFIRSRSNTTAWERELGVLHGCEYQWTIRTVYLAAIKDSNSFNEDGTYLCHWVLLMSRPRVVKVNTIIVDEPPLPTDFSVAWDRTKNALQLRWSPPIDVRNVISGLQIFRRKTIDDPYELVAEYDYNNNMISWSRDYGEIPQPGIVIKGQPSYIFYDYNFKRKTGEEYIYSYATISQHGRTSKYGLQLNARWVNASKGIAVGLVSRTGAPKQHPNLFLERAAEVRGSITKDTVNIENKKKAYLYSDPLGRIIKDRREIVRDYGNYKFAIQSIEHDTGKVASVLIEGENSQ